MSAPHICRGTGRYYRVRMRTPGGRAWNVLQRRFRTKRAAAIALCNKLEDAYYEDGQVLLCTDWQEPNVVLEARKR